MTQQRVCNKCGIEGRGNGRFAAGERASEESSLGRKGNGDGRRTPDVFSAWTRVEGGEGRESHFLSQHVAYCQLRSDCDADREEGGRECVISILN